MASAVVVAPVVAGTVAVLLLARRLFRRKKKVISLDELKEDTRYSAADWEMLHRLLQAEMQDKSKEITAQIAQLEAKIKAGRSRIPHVHQTSFEDPGRRPSDYLGAS